MPPLLFSCTGRLTRRDYALTLGALFGGVSLASFGTFCLLLLSIYLVASLFFRDTGTTFWILFVAGSLGLLTLIYTVLPLLAIPATVRRLHDLGHGGWLAFPLVLASPIILGFSISILLLLLGLLESMKRTPAPLFFDSPDEMGIALGGFFLGYLVYVMLTMLLLFFYAAWVFLKKGTPTANRYGEPPTEEEIPSVYAAYFSRTEPIDRPHFVFRSLIVIAAASIVLPALSQSILYPVAAILGALNLVPVGTDFFTLMIGAVLYPIAALPLVLRRLRTLGRSSWEALMVFAALLPNLVCSAALARFLGNLSLPEGDALGAFLIEGLLSIGSADNSFLMALWVLCAMLSLVGILRLQGSDAPRQETPRT